MKTRYGTWLSALAAAALFACGGSQQGADNSKQQVTVETDNIVIADVASVTLDASLSGVSAFSGALSYSATTGKFSGNIFLAPSATPYDLALTAKKADGTVIGSATGQVTVTATAVASVTLNVASVGEALPAVGFLVTSFQATGYTDVGVAAPFSVSVATAGAAPTFKWTKSTGCNGTFAPNDTSASVTFTDATAQVCTVTVTVTDGVNTALKATKSGQIGVGVNVSVGGTFIPSPTVTQVVLLGNGKVGTATEPTCTIARSGTTRTCASAYKLNAGPTGTPTAFTVGVTYDLGGIFDATKPPTVGLTASCPSSATNGVSLYTPASPIAGSGPGTATCPAAPAVCIGSTTVFWTEPSAFTAPAVSDLCTLTVTVNNQGAVDSLPVFVALTQ